MRPYVCPANRALLAAGEEIFRDFSNLGKVRFTIFIDAANALR